MTAEPTVDHPSLAASPETTLVVEPEPADELAATDSSSPEGLALACARPAMEPVGLSHAAWTIRIFLANRAAWLVLALSLGVTIWQWDLSFASCMFSALMYAMVAGTGVSRQRLHALRWHLKASRRRESRLRAVVHGAPAALWASGEDHASRLFLNSALERPCGISGAKDARAWREAIHPADRERVEHQLKKCFESRRPIALEYRLRRSDGSFAWVSDAGRPRNAKSGSVPSSYLGSIVDVSAIMERETVLRERVQTLLSDRATFDTQMQALRAHAQQSERARATVEATLKARSELLTSVSTELSSAIDGIAGLTELLLHDAPTSEQRLHLSSMQASVDALVRLVHDVLEPANSTSSAALPPDAGALEQVRCVSVADLDANRRAFSRLSLELLSCNLGVVLDLSLGGMRVRFSGRKPPEGSVEIEFNDGEVPVHVRGQIVRCEKTAFRRHELGVRFTDVTPTLARELTRISMLHRQRLVMADKAAA